MQIIRFGLGFSGTGWREVMGFPRCKSNQVSIQIESEDSQTTLSDGGERKKNIYCSTRDGGTHSWNALEHWDQRDDVNMGRARESKKKEMVFIDFLRVSSFLPPL